MGQEIDGSTFQTTLGSISFVEYPDIQIQDVAAPTVFCDVPNYAVRHCLWRRLFKTPGAHRPCLACCLQDLATSVCLPCPAGKDIIYATEVVGLAGCIDCGAGKYRDGNVSALSCTDCPAGSVTLRVKSNETTTATDGSRTGVTPAEFAASEGNAKDDVTNSGAADCTKCPAPQASKNSTTPCALCPAGKFSDPTRQCISCLPGYHSDAGSQQDTIGDTDGNNPQSTTIANESCKKCRDVGPTTGATFEVCLGGAKGGCEESQAGYRPLDSTDMITELDAAQRNLLCTDVSVQQLLSTVRSLTKLSLSQCGTGYYLEGADCEKCGSELLSMILAGVAAVAVTSVSAQQLRLSAFRCVLVFSALRSLTKRCCDRRRRPTGSPSTPPHPRPHAPSVLLCLCLSPLSPLSQACARRYMDVADHIGKAYGEYDYWMAISQGLGQMKRFLALLTPEFGFPASIIELGRQIKGYVYGRHGH